MAEDLTFAKGPIGGTISPENMVKSALKFYSATSTDTHPVFRFVGASVNATATAHDEEFSKVSGAGAAVIGVLSPHVHDDSAKEYYDDVAVGKEATIVHYATKPIWVEAGAGITDGSMKPMFEVSTDANGKAIPATTGHRVAGHGVKTATVEGVVYVAVLLAPAGRVV